ncbi:alpha/beta hydrolase [Streptomyces sp. M19]
MSATDPRARAHTLTVPGHGPVQVTVDDRGQGRPFLLLHGGAGPGSVTGFAGLLAERHPARVLAPTHPGFDGTARPDRLDGVPGLAALYERLLDALDLDDVIVVGNSVGGWIALELALRGSARVSGVVVVDAVGVQVEGNPSPTSSRSPRPSWPGSATTTRPPSWRTRRPSPTTGAGPWPPTSPPCGSTAANRR